MSILSQYFKKKDIHGSTFMSVGIQKMDWEWTLRLCFSQSPMSESLPLRPHPARANVSQYIIVTTSFCHVSLCRLSSTSCNMISSHANLLLQSNLMATLKELVPLIRANSRTRQLRQLPTALLSQCSLIKKLNCNKLLFKASILVNLILIWKQYLNSI